MNAVLRCNGIYAIVSPSTDAMTYFLTYLFSCDAGGVVDEMSDPDAVDAASSDPESAATVSFDVHKPPLASDSSVADHSPRPGSHSPTLVPGIDPVKTCDVVSDVATAMTSRVLASDTIRRQSLSPADRSSSNPTEIADAEENKADSESAALSGICRIVDRCRLHLHHSYHDSFRHIGNSHGSNGNGNR